MDYELFLSLVTDELERIEGMDISHNWDLMRAAGALVTLLDYINMQLDPEAYYS